MLTLPTQRIRIHTDTIATVIRITATRMHILITGLAATMVVFIIAAVIVVDTTVTAAEAVW